jgi:transposase
MAVIAVQADVGDTPKRMADIRARMIEVGKNIPVSKSDGMQPQIITSQPYGIEDIYRPISIQGTVLRAANAGYRQIGMTDARHHFVRGHTSETKVNMVLGRRKRVFVNIDKDNSLSVYGVKLLRMLPENRFMEVHGRFFERLANMEDEELRRLLNGENIEHNGVSCGFNRHCVLAIKDAPELLEAGDPRIREIHGYSLDRFSDGREGVRAMGVQWSSTGLAESFDDAEGGNALLTDDGKPIAYRKNGNRWWERNYGTLVSGEKTDTQRQYDSSAANIDRVWFISEANKGSGYIGNYGLPMWYLKTNYVGQGDKNLVKFATDAFERPVLEMGNEGMYRILDRKTAKLILESNEPERVREVLLQNSKYLGSLPYVSSFLSQWQSVGAYVFSGYGYGVPLDHAYVNSDGFSGVNELLSGGLMSYTNTNLNNKSIPEMTFHPKDGQIKDRTQVFIRGNEEVVADTPMTPMNHTTKNGAGRSWRQIPTTIEGIPLNVITKMAFGLEPTDVNMAKVLRLMNSNGTTIFRFAPNFQTDAQRTAFRQKAIAGIPSMMVGDVGPSGEPKVNPTLLAWLTSVSSNYDKAGKMARAVHDIQTGALSREEAASKHGTTLHNIQVMESRLRKKGVPITPRMGGKAPFSQAELTVNEETGKYGLSPRAIQRIVELRQQGYSLREIAKDVGVSSSNVHKYLARKNMDGRLDADRNRMPDEPDTMP